MAAAHARGSLVTTLLDAGDGSGDAILVLPNELIERLGWAEGDVLDIVEVGHRSLSITKAPQEGGSPFPQKPVTGLDLAYALTKLEELGLEEGDVGYAYWYQVRKLLEQAATMLAQIQLLEQELENLRGKLEGRTD